jgi:hypothetical protein
MASSMVAPIFAGEEVTNTPTLSSAAILSVAVPFPPEMIAPACPILLPGGAVRPAMKETTGFGFVRVMLYLRRYSAASSSADPPISPINMIPTIFVQNKKAYLQYPDLQGTI